MIHPVVVKALADIIAPLVYLIFRASLDSGILPLDWKHGIIRPLSKGGDQSIPSNYRPICLTSLFVKALERVVRKSLDNHLFGHRLLPPEQHGFAPRKSCITNLLLAREDWCEAWDRKTPVHVVTVDFSKAFDRVHHSTLLNKLHDLGIRGKVYRWIQSYLTDRTWCVDVNGKLSDPVRSSSGVPQGAVLGPRLFTIYVHDLPHAFSSQCLLFADDLKIWRRIVSPADTSLLQSDLHSLEAWAATNHLPINPSKSQALVIDRCPSDPLYSLSQHPIPFVSSTRDLGLIIQSDLKTSHHTHKARSSGLRMLWMLRRSFTSWSANLFRRLHTSFIRPVMEYGAPVFFPCTRLEESQLESVQHLGTRMIRELRHHSYEDRCRHLDLFTLEFRRSRADLLFLFRLVVKEEYPELQHLVQRTHSTATRGHAFKLLIPQSDSLPSVYRLSRRAIPLWNALPSDVVTSPSIAVFKQRLDDHFKSGPQRISTLRPGPLRNSPFGDRLTPFWYYPFILSYPPSPRFNDYLYMMGLIWALRPSVFNKLKLKLIAWTTTFFCESAMQQDWMISWVSSWSNVLE